MKIGKPKLPRAQHGAYRRPSRIRWMLAIIAAILLIVGGILGIFIGSFLNVLSIILAAFSVFFAFLQVLLVYPNPSSETATSPSLLPSRQQFYDNGIKKAESENENSEVHLANPSLSTQSSHRIPIKFVHSLPIPLHLASRTKEMELITNLLRDPISRVLSVIAIGGTGKSTLLRHMLNVLDLRSLHFNGCLWFSFYAEPDVDRFLTEACKYIIEDFNPIDYQSPYSKTSVLIENLEKGKSSYLLVLDGIEVMLEDNRDTPRYGTFKNKILGSFLKGICASKVQSRLLITSRWSLTDLLELAGYSELSLPDLSLEAARDYMLQQGIMGDTSQIERICEHYGNHALTLAVLADWLKQPPYFGKIEGVENLRQLPIETPQGIKLQSILDSYWQSLAFPEKYFMTRLSAFRSSVGENALRVLAVDDNGKVCGVDNAIFHRTLRRLRQSALLQVEVEGENSIFVLHPLIKTYFYDRMDLQERQATHLQLRDYARGLPVPNKLKTWEELEPLVELFHQCLGANLWREAVDLFEPGNKLGLYLSLPLHF
jgi:hypothetical protein